VAILASFPVGHDFDLRRAGCGASSKGYRTMTSSMFLASALALSLVSTSAYAAAADDCGVLDEIYRTAKTDFPALKDKQYGGAVCKYRAKEFTCLWGFGTDHYGDAQDQLARLQRCTVAMPNVQPLTKKKSLATFQLNPETQALMRGPDPDNGHWTIQLKLTTTSDWK
jgi:hypothetical protein